MKNLIAFWSALEPGRRVVVAGATLAVFVGVLLLARAAATPPMALLYAGLDPAAAGEVVRALDQRGVPFEVRGESIWVPSAQRDRTRMALASDGLPANGTAGYELLDQLSGFGTTAQMFDAAYMRAKEGELARTIASSPHVRSARVHLGGTQAQPFRRDQRAGASVSITPAAGSVTPAQARAFRHLVAAAVPGLAPEDVAVIDSGAGLVPSQDDGQPFATDDRAQEIRRNVERLLAARVGQGRALVEVSLDFVTEREAISERLFDPQRRVVVSTETEERTSSSQGTPPGVTVASNLPEGDAAQGEGSRAQGSETRERVNYEVSETAREVIRNPGGIRRLTVAVLVDGVRGPDGVWQARSDEELADLRDLVASATGFDAGRGDILTLKSLEFEPVQIEGTASEASILAGIDPMWLIQLLVIAAVVLALGLFVIRPVLTSARAAPQRPALGPPAGQPGSAMEVLTGEIDDEGDPPDLRVIPESRVTQDGEDRADPVARLRRLIAERQDESVEILRGWMEDREEEMR